MGKLVGTILRFVFSWIDAILVKLITTIYKLFSNLSELVLYSDNIIKLIGKRIGLILGIFMLFKLAISLINYMISPDKISDKSKGGGRLIINVGVSLALLISVNFIFKEAYMIQGVIVNSKIIEKIFFGNNGIINKDDSLETKMDIGYYLYSGFITPNVEVFGHSCDEMWDVSVNLQELTDTQKANDDTNVCDDLLIDKLSDNAYKSVYKARNTMDMSYVFYDHELLLESPSERVFAFDYTPIISTAAGVIVLLVLLSFSMDLATRAVKLLFLQIIAPIPIISNMDMGKGQDIFKKWGKECINTYLSVFIRLIAINFAVFMIVLLRGNYKNLFVNNVWLNIFLIIGCLMFAKQVPGLIEEFLGIKLNGMALHPLKKFQEQALFGKQLTGLAGGVGKSAIGAVGGSIAGAKAGGRVGNVFGGTLAGAFMGVNAARSSKNPFSSSLNGVYKNLMGTDFVNFSITKGLLGLHGEDRVNEVKTARNSATDLLNQYNSQLNTSESVSARLANSLSSRGYNVNNFQGESERIQREKQDRKDQINEINNSIQSLKEKLTDTNLSESEKNEIKVSIQQQETKVNSLQHTIDNLDTAAKDISKYTSAIKEQNELRSRISAVQKDIDDLNNEKRQRERFYGYDPSPSDDIRELISDTKTPSSYEDRIDKRVSKDN